MKVALGGAAVVALITFGICWQPQRQSLLTEEPLSAEDLSQRRVVVRDLSTAKRVARASFYDASVAPQIDKVDQQNREAAERCLQRVHDLMQGYHGGVDGFVNEMTSISTRLGVLKRMPAAWWKADGRIESYVENKFQQHLFSEESLVEAITAILLQFREEVHANQTRMLTQIRAALSTADLPDVKLTTDEEFFRELSTDIGGYAANQGTTSVENMLGALVLGEVGAFAGRSVIAGLLVRFAPSVAIGSAAGASATVGASATGAGGGSLGGPIGTAVGFGAGLAIGLVIDWWMTERFEAELSRQMHVYLYDLERALVSGEMRDAKWSNTDLGDRRQSRESGGAVGSDVASTVGGSGLEVALPELCGALREAYRDRFYQQIVDGESS